MPPAALLDDEHGAGEAPVCVWPSASVAVVSAPTRARVDQRADGDALDLLELLEAAAAGPAHADVALGGMHDDRGAELRHGHFGALARGRRPQGLCRRRRSRAGQRVTRDKPEGAVGADREASGLERAR